MADDNKMKLILEAEANSQSADKAGQVIGNTAGKAASKALNDAISVLSKSNPAVTGISKNLKITSARKTLTDALAKTTLSPEQMSVAALDPKLQKWTAETRMYITSLQQEKAEHKEINKLLREKDSLAAQKRLSTSRQKMQLSTAEGKSAIRLREEAAKLQMREQARQIREAATATERMGGIMGRVTGIFEKFGRVLTWRLYRMAAQKVIQMMVEGIQALVNWDAEFGNNTSGALSTMTEIKSTIDQVKRSLGAMAMPIIQVVMPIFRAFANTIMFVANLINQVVRALQGYGTYMKAVYVETSAVADETKKATGAAKELQRVLFGFDDLNILPDENGRKGYGGTGALDGIPKYEEVEISVPVKFIFDRKPGNIVDFFASPFEELGKIFSDVFGKDGLLENPVNGFKEAWKQFGEDMKKSWETFKTNLGLDKAAAWISTAWQNVKKALAEGWQGVKNAPVLGDVVRVLGDIFSGRAFTGEYWSGLWTGFKNDMQKAWGGISSWVKGKVIDPIVNAFDTGWGYIKNFFINPINAAFDALIGTVGAFVNFLIHPSNWSKAGWEEMTNEVRMLWTDAFDDIEKKQDEFLATQNLKKFQEKWKEGVEKLPPVGISTSFNVPTNGSNVHHAGKVAVAKLDPIGFGTTLSPVRNFMQAKDAAQLEANKMPITFSSAVLTSGLGYALSVAWEALQRTLNNNPLTYATSVGTYATTAAVLASKKKSIAMAYASGGVVPNAGQLIQVNEAGPEVVANLGHSTGIMNVNQMQEAVAAGNIDVVNAIYGMASMVVNAVNNKDLDVYMDSAKVGQSVTTYQNNQMRRGVAY